MLFVLGSYFDSTRRVAGPCGDRIDPFGFRGTAGVALKGQPAMAISMSGLQDWVGRCWGRENELDRPGKQSPGSETEEKMYDYILYSSFKDRSPCQLAN